MIHGVRDHFQLKDFLIAREKTISIVDNLVNDLESGMGELDCLEIINKRLNDLGVAKKWHPTKFRIGEDTLKSFSEKSEFKQVLKTGEIFFIDIGPVWDGYEGDYGQTFVFGEDLYNYQGIANAAETVFKETASFWRDSNASGNKLYEFAATSANDLGFELNPKMKGHRLGDFPHHLFYRGGLSETEEVPVDHLWVLEILIRDEKTKRGAFFEDILSKKNSFIY